MKLKLGLFIAAFFLTSLQVFAASIDKSYESRIVAACVKSVEENGKNIPNYKVACRCIGQRHYNSALGEDIQAEAEDHIKWTTEFYETFDLKRLQRMVDRNPKWSSFDDQVVDDCMMSAAQGLRK